jgi:myo-inositol 2-dehydrogenase/D-chiro-inositol 1-dehydrogenase
MTKPKPNTTRRQFLKTTGAATAATAVSAATHAHAAGSDSFKVGLVGAGGRGSGAVVQNLMNEGTELVAVAEAYQDRLEGGLKNIAKAHKGAGKINIPEDQKFIGLDAYKNAIDASDVCILTTPPGFRPMMFEYAIEQGKNVFMEKPVCTDAAGYRRVIAAAKKADEKGLKVVVGLQRRYADNYREAYQKVQDGVIGDVIAAQCYWNGGGVWTRPRAALAETLGREPTEMEYQIYNWYYFPWIGGDNIAEQHVHNLDVCNWFMDESHPAEAYGSGGRSVRHGPDSGYIFDHHNVEFKESDGRFMNSQCRHFPGSTNQVGEVIIGTNGRLEMSKGLVFDNKGNVVDRIRADGSKGGSRNPYEIEHAELYKAIRQDKPLNNAYYGADSSMTAVLGRMSTYSGKRLTWDEAINSQVDIFPETLAWDAEPRVLPGPDGNYPHAIPGTTKVV